jgi:hypothetical protein
MQQEGTELDILYQSSYSYDAFLVYLTTLSRTAQVIGYSVKQENTSVCYFLTGNVKTHLI